MFKQLKNAYKRAPLPVKRCVLLLPYPVLAGNGYRRTLRMCRESDTMSRPAVLQCQERLLGSLLQYAVRNVPFYERFRPVVEELAPFEALRHLPLLTKDDVQRNLHSLVSHASEGIPHHEGSTGGSSGNHLTFLEDDATYGCEMAFMHSQWKRVGYAPVCRKATFRGVVFDHVTDAIFWRENPIHHELQFSPFHMNEGTLGLYVEKLSRYRPEFIHGYPSAVETLAEYVLRHGLTGRMPPIRAALLGSEGCSQVQRERVEAAFRTRVYTWYGHSERTVLGGECECSRICHAFPAYGVLEILREDGTPCEVGEQGEMVGTGFLNRAMPLIRYRTDDYATREPPVCECGRCWDRFSNVLGRRSLEGFIFGKGGSRISAAALNMHGDVFRNVTRYQYYQDAIGQLVIRVIPTPGYSPQDEKMIVAEHQRKLWGEMDVLVQPVDDIPLTKAGKQRRIICDVRNDREFGDLARCSNSHNSSSQVK